MKEVFNWIERFNNNASQHAWKIEITNGWLRAYDNYKWNI